MEQSDMFRDLQMEQFAPMQEAARGAYQSNKDLVLLSPTGSGKTLAFLLPPVQSLEADVWGVQTMVLVPSREFALQMGTVFKSMNVPLKSMSCYGRRPAMEEHRTMRGINLAVIIGTPGRMNDHLRKRNFEAHSVTTLVIGESDKCLESSFHDEIAEVIGQLPVLQKRVLLSATDAEEIPQFVEVGGAISGSDVSSSQAIRLNFLSEEAVSDRPDLQKTISLEKDKLETLYRLLCALGDRSTLVFVNYCKSVERMATYLKPKKFPCDAFHDGMEQEDRERAPYRFRNGSCPVLVSTDLAARGLDIPGIDNVVYYHISTNEEVSTHRNGHTACWEAHNSFFLLPHAEEQLSNYLPEEIPVFGLPEQTLKPVESRWVTLYIGEGKKDKPNEVGIVDFLCKEGGLACEDVGQVGAEERCAPVAVRRSKVRQLLTLLRGEKIKGMKILIEEARQTDVIRHDGECY